MCVYLLFLANEAISVGLVIDHSSLNSTVFILYFVFFFYFFVCFKENVRLPCDDGNSHFPQTPQQKHFLLDLLHAGLQNTKRPKQNAKSFYIYKIICIFMLVQDVRSGYMGLVL